jgi:hypothetical protein
MVLLAVDCCKDEELDKCTLLNYFLVHYKDKDMLMFSVLGVGAGGINESEYDKLSHDSPIHSCCSVDCVWTINMQLILQSEVDTNRLPMFLPVCIERTIVSGEVFQKHFRVVVFPITFSLDNGCEYTVIGATLHKVNYMNSFYEILCHLWYLL